MKKLNKSLIFSLMLLSAVFCSINASALGETVDTDRKGSVSLTLCDVEGNKSLAGAEISIYQVAFISNFDYTLHYELTADFKESGISVGDFSDDKLPEKLAEYTSGNCSNSLKAVTDKNGTVCFSELPLGIYLVAQSGSVAGYTDFNPFLVSVPIKDAHGYEYDIFAVPKTGLVRLVDIEVYKKWNDGEDENPESVQIQLLKNKEPVETVLLNEENGWHYVWKQLPSDEDWSVREINVPKGYTPTYEQNGYSFTVVNSSTLTYSGEIDWPVPLLSVLGMFLILIGSAVYLKQRKKSNV